MTLWILLESSQHGEGSENGISQRPSAHKLPLAKLSSQGGSRLAGVDQQPLVSFAERPTLRELAWVWCAGEASVS